MNYRDGQRLTFDLTEKEALPLVKQMADNYAQARDEIIAEMERIYGKYLSTTDPQDYYNIMIQYDRLNKLLEQVQGKYREYATAAGEQIQEISELAMTNTFYRNQYMLTWFDMSENMTFSTLDPVLMELTVTGEIELYKQLAKQIEDAKIFLPKYGTLSSIIEKNQTYDLIEIQKAITQGFIQGWSISDMSSSIMDIFDTAQYQAERIALTEFTRCSNAGDYAATLDASDQGLNVTRMWMATLDDRTREEHQMLDGQVVGVDDPFEIEGYSGMYPGDFGAPEMDINCRCTTITLIDGEEPELRGGRNPETGDYEIFDFSNYNDWMESNGMSKNDSGKWIKAA